MRMSFRPSAASQRLKLLAVSVLLGVAACTPPPPTPAPPAGAAGPQDRHFTGSWSASGSRQALDMGPGRRAENFRLSVLEAVDAQAREGPEVNSVLLNCEANVDADSTAAKALESLVHELQRRDVVVDVQPVADRRSVPVERYRFAGEDPLDRWTGMPGS